MEQVSKRKLIACPSCDSSACKKCTQHYLTQKETPLACMKCKKAWTLDFLYRSLPKSWIESPKGYQGALKDFLLEREKAKLPHTSAHILPLLKQQITSPSSATEAALHRRRKLEVAVERTKLQARIATLKLQEFDCTDKKKSATLTKQIASCRKQLQAIQAPKIVRKLTHQSLYIPHSALTAGGDDKGTLLGPCPSDSCRGLVFAAALSAQHTEAACGVCKKEICVRCFCVVSSQHSCDPQAVATQKLLRKDSKPCPKCGVRITRVDGCYQMWCTACKTPFSWTTGEIITDEVIHNPHMFEGGCDGDFDFLDTVLALAEPFSAIAGQLCGCDLRPTTDKAKKQKLFQKAFGTPIFPATADKEATDTLIFNLFIAAGVFDTRMRNIPDMLDRIELQAISHRVLYLYGHESLTQWRDNIFSLHRKRQALLLGQELMQVFLGSLTTAKVQYESQDQPAPLKKLLETIIRTVHLINSEYLKHAPRLLSRIEPLILPTLLVPYADLYGVPSAREAEGYRFSNLLNHDEYLVRTDPTVSTLEELINAALSVRNDTVQGAGIGRALDMIFGDMLGAMMNNLDEDSSSES